MRKLTPLIVETLMALYCGSLRGYSSNPAQQRVLQDFAMDGLTIYRNGATVSLSQLGHDWAERVLATLPPRGNGGKAEGYYIIGKSEGQFGTIEAARREAIAKCDNDRVYPGYGQGAYVLKAVELLEPLSRDTRFRTTFLS